MKQKKGDSTERKPQINLRAVKCSLNVEIPSDEWLTERIKHKNEKNNLNVAAANRIDRW